MATCTRTLPPTLIGVKDRRTVLRVGFGAAVAAVLSACGANKTPVADAAASTTDSSTGSASAEATSTVATESSPETGATAAPSGSVASTGLGELVVSFEYVATASTAGGGGGGRTGGPGGRIHNPYVAVWLETPDGKPVRTIDLSYQRGKGNKWLPDLQRWYRADQARVAAGGKQIADTISTATRLPGTVSVVWNGLDDAGKPVAAGDYVLSIESAREKGPYHIIRETISFGGDVFTKSLTDEGDLQKVNVEYKRV